TEVLWIDIQDHLSRLDSLEAIYRTKRKSIFFSLRNASRLPDDYEALRILAVEHQEMVSQMHIEDDRRAVGDFMGYVILVTLYDGDPDAWIRWLRKKGSIDQLLTDLP